MADESTGVGTKKQMSVCVRNVDKQGNVNEDIIGFVELQMESIERKIVTAIHNC
jgi:hypothetical protein